MEQPELSVIKKTSKKQGKKTIKLIEGSQEPKQKRKYTRKKQITIVEEPIKPKRKYTKKNKIVVIEEQIGEPIKKSSRKYTKKNKKEEKENIKDSVVIIQEPTKVMSQRWNEKLVNVLEEMEKIMMKQGEPFKARAYSKAKESILEITTDIVNIDDIKGKKAIGKSVFDTLKEFVDTGKVGVIERERNNPVNILSDIYGVGPKKAKELVEKNNIKTIEELRTRQDDLLNEKQKIGLKYYEDIQERIPRQEIEEFASVFENIFKEVSKKDKNAKFEIVGSYRRGAMDSGDIDVIMTDTNNSVFKAFIDKLIQNNIIVEVLSRGNTKSLTIAKLPNKTVARRIDFLYSSLNEYPFSILYFTGSKAFNTVMRAKALEKGYSMNEHGITNKTTGKLVEEKFSDEKLIFDFLNLQYKEPIDRIDGRSVVEKTNEMKELSTEVKPEEAVENIVIKRKTVKKTIKKREPSIKEEKEPEKEPEKEKKQKKKEGKTTKEQIEEPIVKPSVISTVNDFKKKGISVLENLSKEELEDIIRESNNAYYNEQPFFTDNEYDIVKEFIQNKFPEDEVTLEVGAPVQKNKVKLPYEMWSMDKIKPDTNALTNWMSTYNGPYVISCKLDGVSGMYIYDKKTPKLYTRGDGKVGQDVSHLIPFLKLPKKQGMVIRGEFIMSKKVFEEKYSKQFANARNLVAGIVNRQTLDDKIKDIDFVAYELITPQLRPSEQMNTLKQIGAVVVQNQIEETLTNDSLSELLQKWRVESKYDIDGIIVTDDNVYPRESGNPKHAFAFKMVLSDQLAEVKVVDVIWTASKDGYLKPRVRIEPVQLGGVRVEYSTGFNGAFIENNKIGIGAIIQIVRSGDVIPYIKSVVQPASEPKMPDVPYEWNNTHIDVVLKDKGDNQTVIVKNIAGFFKGIEVDGLGEGNVERIVKAGYNSIPKVIKMKKEDFLKVDGFKDTMANKLETGIKQKLLEAPLALIMASSNIFGRGFSKVKIEAILKEYPNVLKSRESNDEKISKIQSIKGFSKTTAELFVENIPSFLSFLKECNLDSKLEMNVTEPVQVKFDHPLYEKAIIMTGFRDKNIEEKIKGVGARVASSVSKNVFVVLTKDKEEKTGKIEKARELGIMIMTPDEFLKEYF